VFITGLSVAGLSIVGLSTSAPDVVSYSSWDEDDAVSLIVCELSVLVLSASKSSAPSVVSIVCSSGGAFEAFWVVCWSWLLVCSAIFVIAQ